jgi:hypothetical protein
MPTVPSSGKSDAEADSTPAGSPIERAPSDPGATATETGSTRLWVSAFGAALVAGVLAWAIGELTYDYYGPSQEAIRSTTRYDFNALKRSEGLADQKNAAIAFGTFGALLGLTLGTLAGLSRRPSGSVFTASLTGLLAAGIGGALVSYGLAPVFGRFYNDVDPSLMLPIVIRGGICAVVGLAAGLAFGLGRHDPTGIIHTLSGGLLGGILGIIFFEVIIATLFPMERNDKVIPSSLVTRLLCYLCVAAGVAAGAILLERSRLKPASRTPSTQP